MTDEELRRLVREAIARHLGGAPGPGAGGGSDALGSPAGGSFTGGVASSPVAAPPAYAKATADKPEWRAHPSFGRFLTVEASGTAGGCVIEPAVPCNHCGYCQSYGH